MANGKRGKQKRGNSGPSMKPQPPRLAPELFPELNATFYQDDPSDYLVAKIEALTLMLAPDAALAAAYAADREVGVMRLAGSDVPPREARERYLRIESVLLIHHASELLLRLFFAHVEKPDCPWFGMAASTSFIEFKNKVSNARRVGFDRDAVAAVFLGGINRIDAVVAVEDAEFEDGVKAAQILLEFAACTVLDESFLYNAAKHGLTIVQTDDETRTAFIGGDGQMLTLNSGPMFAYIHKQQFPGAPSDKGLPEWHMSQTNTLPDQDIGVAILIRHAVSSLWDVARRKYTERRGNIELISSAAVLDAICGPVVGAQQIVRTHTDELAKKDGEGNFLGKEIKPIPPHMPNRDEWQPGASAGHPVARRIPLPVRQRDRRIVNTSGASLLPISPRGASRV